MKLTFCTPKGTVSAKMTIAQFNRLRDPSILPQEISEIASSCKIDESLLYKHIQDLHLSAKVTMEIDGACDYSDHL